MQLVASRLTFPLLCLAVGLVVFSVSYTMLGQGPEGNVGDRPPGSTPDPTPGGPGAGEGELGPVGVVNELFEVIEGGNVADLEALLRGGADPNEANTHGHTALHWSIATDSPVVYGQVRALLNAGANPNLADKKGLTPLHLAALSGTGEAVTAALIESGGDPLLTTVANSPSAYELAIQTGNKGAVAAIERSTTYRPDNRAKLEARGVYFQRMREVFQKPTVQEKRAAIMAAVDGFERSGYLDAAGAKTLRQEFEKMLDGMREKEGK